MDNKSVGTSAPEGELSPIPPGVPAKCVAGLAVMNAGKPLAGYGGDTTEVLAQLADGKSVPTLAKELKISESALYAWLLAHNPEEWKAIVASKALQRVEKAEIDMDAADDAIKISKARESHKMGAWALERVSRAIYGDTKNGSGDTIVQVLVSRDGESTAIQVQTS